MRRTIITLVLLCVVFISSGALPAYAALVPCDGPECQACHLVTLGSNLLTWFVGFMASIVTLVFVWGGMKMVMSAGETGSISEAKGMMTNAVIGLLILLAAWLIINTVMKTIVHDPDLTNWSEIKCVAQPGRTADPKVTTVAGSGATIPGVTGEVQTGTGNCTPDSIKTAASAGGYTLTDAQAQTFSCIAPAESSCNNNPPPAKTPSGVTTSASGMFQIILGYDDKCHNLSMPVCTEAARAAGYTFDGELNCFKGYDKTGTVRPGMEVYAQACKAAASNFNCNVSAAACLMQMNGGSFGAWTADPNSSKQQSCILKYNR